MGLLDFFRPAWRHSNSDIRLDVVRGLTEDDDRALAEVVARDADSRIRRLAVKKLRDLDLLADTAKRDSDGEVRENAASRCDSLLRRAAMGTDDQALVEPVEAVKRLQQPTTLMEVARDSRNPEARWAALGRLSDPKSLAQVAIKGKELPERLAAVSRLSDEAVLAEIAIASDHRAVGLAALVGIKNEDKIRDIEKNARGKAVRQEARTRLPDAPADVAPSRNAAEAKRERQRLLEICIQLEQTRRTDDWAATSARLATAEDRWSEVGRVPGDEALQKRFEGIRADFAARRQAAERAEKVRQAHEEETRQKRLAEQETQRRRAAESKAVADAPVVVAPVVEKAVAEAPRDVAPIDEKTLALTALCGRLDTARRAIPALSEVTTERLDAWEAEFRALDPDAGSVDAAAESTGDEPSLTPRRRFFTSLRQARKQLSDRQAALAAAHKAVTESLQALTALSEAGPIEASTNRKAMDAALKRARQAAKTVALIQGAPADLQATFAQVRTLADAVDARLAALIEEDRWRRWANLPKFETLIKEAEALVEVLDTVEEKAAVPSLLKEMQGRWKAAGTLPAERSQELWQRFSKACDAAFAKCAGDVAAERADNQKKKEDLCEKAEFLKEGTDWKAVSDALKGLQDEWKTVGPAPEVHQEALWTRFRAAQDFFYARRTENDKARDAERVTNGTKKTQLCVEAERLASSTDWRGGGEAFKALQEQWKATGPAPRDKNEELWMRFRSACDRFFQARQAAFAVADAERVVNLKKKEDLCVEAEALAKGEDREAARNTVRELQRRWKLVGHVPREDADKVWGRFRTACDLIFQDPEGESLQDLPAGLADGDGFTNRLPMERLIADPSGDN